MKPQHRIGQGNERAPARSGSRRGSAAPRPALGATAAMRVPDVFADLLELPAASRAAAAREACQGEPEVLREVLRLLPHAPEGEEFDASFLDPPALPGWDVSEPGALVRFCERLMSETS